MILTLTIDFSSKIRITFENLTARLKAGQTEAEAANNTGIEYTQAAEASFIKIYKIFLRNYGSFALHSIL